MVRNKSKYLYVLKILILVYDNFIYVYTEILLVTFLYSYVCVLNTCVRMIQHVCDCGVLNLACC